MTKKILERRFEICLFLLESRITHYEEIMDRFNISKPTAIGDIRFISEYLIALDTQPGCAGYIKVLKSGAQSSLIRLSHDDATVLLRLYKAIKEYDYEMIVNDRQKIIVVLNKLMTLHLSPNHLQDVL